MTVTLGSVTGARTFLFAPFACKREFIGNLTARRNEVRPFTLAQIKLLETFADQAVIAIENVRLFQELKESLEQQTATSEILGVIASSPTDIQPVLDAVAESAARLCDAFDAVIFRRDGDRLRLVAHYGQFPTGSVGEFTLPLVRGSPNGRSVLDGRTIHVADLQSEMDEFPEGSEFASQFDFRTVLLVPLMREGVAIGSIGLRRMEVKPFTNKQVALLETFASQAVIAIENVRLFKELQERNRDLTEALEQQTATSEVLKVISRSTFDLQPVLETLVENATRLCGAVTGFIFRPDGERLHIAAAWGASPELIAFYDRNPPPPGRGTLLGRTLLERRTVHIEDCLADPEYRWAESQKVAGYRTLLGVPLLREGVPLGIIGMWREEVRPFTDKQIELVTTFADQAVIAIENVRLLQELQNRNRDLTEALEQQTATSKILEVIASSPTDVQPVLDAVASSATRLCDASDAIICRLDGSRFYVAAHSGLHEGLPAGSAAPLIRGLPPGRAVLDRATIVVADMAEAVESEFPETKAMQQRYGYRSVAFTPLLREGSAIGALGVLRTEVRPFTEKQIALLKTFADQAVIAIENVRLFQELEARTQELAKSVGELRALGAVSQAVSSTLDLETVLATIASHAVQLSATDCGVIYEYDDTTEEFHLRASHRMEGEVVEILRAAPIHLGQGATGRAVIMRQPVQVSDISSEREFTGARARPVLVGLGYRSLLAVPLLREQEIMGALTVWRRKTGEFKPEVVNLLQTFATQSALAIQNARLSGKSRRRAARSRRPTGTSRSFSPTCPTSCEPRSTPSLASLKSWAKECSAS